MLTLFFFFVISLDCIYAPITLKLESGSGTCRALVINKEQILITYKSKNIKYVFIYYMIYIYL